MRAAIKNDGVRVYEFIRDALEQAVVDSGSPGGVVYVGNREETFGHVAYGLRRRDLRRSARLDTLYDIASLTKVVATTSAVMLLRDAGLLRLDQSVTDFVPIPAYSGMTLHHLLTHTAGLTPDNPFYDSVSSMDELLQRYGEQKVLHAPGVEQQYSDVGFMLLGRMVELVAQDSLDHFCHANIFEPLGMERTAFNPPAEWTSNCAATERSAWRGRVIVGEVHDENAYAVGGVAGHAGLFSTATDLARFCRGLLTGALVSESTLAEITKLGTLPSYPWQGLGWEVDPWSSKKKGFLPSRAAFGHTGWTGTSMWLDRDSGLFVILLGNTCHPSREDMDNETFRRGVHLPIAKHFFPRTTSVHSGLDRLVRENFEAVMVRRRRGRRGKPRRMGVLTNHASVDQLGRPITETLRLTDRAVLSTLFSPEHGIRGTVERGLKAGEEQAEVPVIGLYRTSDAELLEGLRDVDLLLVDLQDVGARYYTYNYTMRRCIAACAASRTPILVLDRPNPVGGTVLEGPIAKDTSTAVSCAAIPVRHGMTMGELAMHYVETELQDAQVDLRVSWLDNWPRERLFDECAYPWVPPSPNIPTPRTALLYVGTCLFEGVNLNEGRGTETPFEIVGAPWLDAEAVAQSIDDEDLAGLALSVQSYVPRSIPGKASTPRYRDEECQGIRITVNDPHAARPFTLALALLVAMHRRHEEQLVWDEAAFDALAGGDTLRNQIIAGRSARDIVRGYADELADFDATRPRLYDADGIPIELSESE